MWLCFVILVRYKSKKKIDNKSTVSGAIYARSLVIFPHRMAFVRGGGCSEEGAKTKSDKKFWGKRGEG